MADAAVEVYAVVFDGVDDGRFADEGGACFESLLEGCGVSVSLDMPQSFCDSQPGKRKM